MNVEVRYGPAYALALVNLDHKETIQVEGGAMVGMTGCRNSSWRVCRPVSTSLRARPQRSLLRRVSRSISS